MEEDNSWEAQAQAPPPPEAVPKPKFKFNAGAEFKPVVCLLSCLLNKRKRMHAVERKSAKLFWRAR